MARNSKIIIAKNIKIDKEYKEVLNYTEQQMLTLVNANKVDSADTYSYIRDTGEINTHFTYGDCLKCNYMAFQNPDYDNKWFFAFIDDIKYVNDGSTNIKFTIDSWSTWFDKLTINSSFVVREHTNDDTIGNNTLPENLETGEYIINDFDNLDEDGKLSNPWICLGVSWLPTNAPVSDDDRVNGSVFSGLYYVACPRVSDASKFISAYDSLGKAEQIYTVFEIPEALADNVTLDNYDFGGQTNIRMGFFTGTVVPRLMMTNITLNSPNRINGYNPKNNKLFCYPYNYLYITNNNGIDVTYNYEDFINNSPIFKIYGTVCTGCSMRIVPENYKKASSTQKLFKQSAFGITAGKWPTCSWQSDSYTNWLTQNAINIPFQIAGDVLSIGGGIATGNSAVATSGFLSIGSSLSTMYQHSLVAEQSKGNVNAGDVLIGMKMNLFTYFKMSIKEEYARCIDNYFTRFGYKTNLTKVPNITGRRYWNYIQLADTEVLGYGEVPQKYVDDINKIARQGVTIWHDHTNIGDYSLNNTIV